MENNEFVTLNEFSSNFLRQYAYKHGNEIYSFMNKYDIGVSEFGKLMDAAAKGKKVMAHRLYGHHMFYDLPITNLNKVGEFYQHLFSDLFTKQGLPILPGELLEDANLLDYCKGLSDNWNFVNGFDILTATIAIYQGGKTLKIMLESDLSIDTIEDFSKIIGVGAIELALAISLSNSFLLIGAVIQLTSGIVGLFNEGSRVFIQMANNKFKLDFNAAAYNLQDLNKKYLPDNLNQCLISSLNGKEYMPTQRLKKILKN